MQAGSDNPLRHKQKYSQIWAWPCLTRLNYWSLHTAELCPFISWLGINTRLMDQQIFPTSPKLDKVELFCGCQDDLANNASPFSPFFWINSHLCTVLIVPNNEYLATITITWALSVSLLPNHLMTKGRGQIEKKK